MTARPKVVPTGPTFRGPLALGCYAALGARARGCEKENQGNTDCPDFPVALLKGHLSCTEETQLRPREEPHCTGPQLRAAYHGFH